MKKRFELKTGKSYIRHFYNGREYELDYKNKVVRLNPEFHNLLMAKKLWGKFGVKKIGGSSLGNVLGSNKFGSRFEESLRLLWLAPPISEMKYIEAGQAIEPKIIDVIRQAKTGVHIEGFSAEQYNYDYFKNDPDIGGLPDAAAMANQQVYEIKTTGKKNYDKWIQYGVPEYYKQQVALYDYLMFGKDRKETDANCPRIVACFLEPEDYSDPANVDITKRSIKTFPVAYPKAEIEGWIKKVKSFRKVIFENGISYPWTDKDTDLIEFLECRNEDEVEAWLKKHNYL